jgi:hypothetical protein
VRAALSEVQMLYAKEAQGGGGEAPGKGGGEAPGKGGGEAPDAAPGEPPGGEKPPPEGGPGRGPSKLWTPPGA